MRIFATLAAILLTISLYGQTVREAEFLTPEDLGAYKWVLSGTAAEGEVVIFRMVTTRVYPNGEKNVQTYDSVTCMPGKEQQASALFINPNYWHTDAPQNIWRWRALGSSGTINGKYQGDGFDGKSAHINFEGENGTKYTYRFSSYVMSYEGAKKLHPDLPDYPSPGAGWGWAGFIEDDE